MAARGLKRLVIDVSVARAAGGAEHPVSKSSRHFLLHVLEICHSVVMTSEISEEWKKHRSSLARKWQASMTARKKVSWLERSPDKKIRRAIERSTSSSKRRDAMRKDIHLVEAALAADRIIVSGDESARRLFSSLSSTVPSLRSLTWVNPAQPADDCMEWLKAGARSVVEWQLGFGLDASHRGARR